LCWGARLIGINSVKQFSFYMNFPAPKKETQKIM
jgi:hypothetical protein